MAQILVYFFRWYLRRDHKPSSDDMEVGDGEQATPGQRDDHESDITAHDNDDNDDNDDVERVPIERIEEKNTVKTG